MRSIALAFGLGFCIYQTAMAGGTARPLERQELGTIIDSLGFDSLLMIQRQPLNPTHVYTYHVEGLAKGGGLYIRALKDGKLTRLVDAAEGVILDAQVSYDGGQILFSWKRTMQEPFNIWRVNADGANLTRVIHHDSNNMNACWLPDGGIAFLSDRKPAFAYCWTSTSPVLYRADGDGGNVVRLSANYLTDFTPSVMEDGRILFSRWEYVDRPAIPIQSLWAINPDGTLLAGVFGNRVLSPATFMEAKDIPGMQGKILCVMTSHNGPCRGAIGLLDLSKGGNAQEAIRNLTPEIGVGPVNDAGAGNALRGPYESPVPLDARFYLVSREGRILLRDYEGAVEATLCEPEHGLGFYSAQPLRSRPLPRSSPVSRVNPQAEPWADVVLNDVTIGLGNAVKPGEIKRIAVVQEMEKDLRYHAVRLMRPSGSGDSPMLRRMARRISGFPPTCRSISCRSMPRGARCSGCAPSLTSCRANARAASAAMRTAIMCRPPDRPAADRSRSAGRRRNSPNRSGETATVSVFRASSSPCWMRIACAATMGNPSRT